MAKITDARTSLNQRRLIKERNGMLPRNHIPQNQI